MGEGKTKRRKKARKKRRRNTKSEKKRRILKRNLHQFSRAVSSQPKTKYATSNLKLIWLFVRDMLALRDNPTPTPPKIGREERGKVKMTKGCFRNHRPAKELAKEQFQYFFLLNIFNTVFCIFKYSYNFSAYFFLFHLPRRKIK